MSSDFGDVIYRYWALIWIKMAIAIKQGINPRFREKVNARYVRIKAIQYGKLPAWHLGAGGDTHIFVDEINIK